MTCLGQHQVQEGGLCADLSSLNADAVTHCGTWGGYVTSEPCVLGLYVVTTVPLS